MSRAALSSDQFHSTTENGGWGSLPSGYKAPTGKQNKERRDEEFRIARHAETLAEEHVTSGHATDTAMYREANGPRLNYRDWMRSAS